MFRLVAFAAVLAATIASAAPREAPPSPADWWKPPSALAEAADPLGGRRGLSPPVTPQRVEASYYRLWGLFPIQSQVLRPNEAILELWVHPQFGGRESVIRITVRDDGRAFVQARAGFGCCAPGILKRVDVDEELVPGSAARFLDLAKNSVWRESEEVETDEGDGTVEGLCVGGSSYDLYVVTAKSAAHLRRDCTPEEIGQVAPILSPMLAAALGRDARFDAVFPKGAGFSEQAEAYAKLIAVGGKLAPPKRR